MKRLGSILLVGGAALALSACHAAALPAEEEIAAVVTQTTVSEAMPIIIPDVTPTPGQPSRVFYVDLVDPEAEVYRLASDGGEFQVHLKLGYATPVDDELGRVISLHVQEILDRRYAYGMNQEDFFHGHFLFEPNSGHIGEVAVLEEILEDPAGFTFEERMALNRNRDDAVTVGTTLEAYQSSVSLILYHTREWTGDSDRIWKGAWPGAEVRAPGWDHDGPGNLPRSIIGTLEGGLVIPTSENPGYYSRGNVVPLDPFFFEGDILSEPRNGILIDDEVYEARYGHVRMEIDGAEYTTWGEFYLVKDTDGNYKLRDELRYNILLQLSPVK